MPETELVPMAANAEVLMSPDRATSLVSRGEVVNLVVVQYIDKVQRDITEAEAEKIPLSQACKGAWLVAYEAWSAEILSRVEPRLNPWRNAVANALGNVPLTELSCEGLPRVSQCEVHESGVHAPHRHGSSRSEHMGVTDLIRAWTDRSHSQEKPNFRGPVQASTYGGNKQAADLTKFPMLWTFSRVNSNYVDWHSITINVDVTPSDEVVALLEVALNAYRACCESLSKLGHLRDEIDDKNIKSLERRALAKLTMQALGENHKFPALG